MTGPVLVDSLVLSYCPTDGWIRGTVTHVISPDFPLELTGISPEKHSFHFLVLKMKDFRNFLLHYCIPDLALNKFT